MNAFLAFLEYVHSLLTTTYHNTPILLMASPSWAHGDYEAIARYIFEQTKTPALCIIMSSIATQYGIKWPSMCVVDIGFQKVDCTAIHDFQIVNHCTLGFYSQNQPTEPAGGDVFTCSLMEKLKKKNFTYDMAEQLKKSHICEVLPYAANEPDLVDLPTEQVITVSHEAPIGISAEAAPVSTTFMNASVGALTENQGPKPIEPATSNAKSATKEENEEYGEKSVDSDGVLDVATIVASGQAKEFLAKKEKEKQDVKAKTKKGKGAGAGMGGGQDGQEQSSAQKVARLPNSKRVKNIFHYEEVIEEEVMVPVKELSKADAADIKMVDAPASREGLDFIASAPPAATPEDALVTAPAEGSGTNGTTTASSDEHKMEEKKEESKEGQPQAPERQEAKEEVPTKFIPERQIRKIRRDIEVGLERFTFATREEIDRLATLIYTTIQGVPEPYMRSPIWENVVFVGNGSRLRGLKENVMATLNARHLVSPSTATMFLSELPSNIATPSGTGAQTPTPLASFNTPPHQLAAGGSSSSVNPLLQAATTASLQLPHNKGTPGPSADSASNAGGGEGGSGVHSKHSHSQTPTHIRMAPLPSYLGEWTKNGYEEAMFLGSLIGARTAFCPAHNVDRDTLEHIRTMSLTRVDYK